MSTLNKTNTVKKDFPQILKDTFGIVSIACNKVNINRTTYYNWRNSDIEFAKACDEAIEYTGDFVESKLLKLIKDENVTAIIFFCKTKLKNRGYVERIEQTGKGEEPIKSEIKQLNSPIDQEILDRYYQERKKEELNLIN